MVSIRVQGLETGRTPSKLPFPFGRIGVVRIRLRDVTMGRDLLGWQPEGNKLPTIIVPLPGNIGR